MPGIVAAPSRYLPSAQRRCHRGGLAPRAQDPQQRRNEVGAKPSSVAPVRLVVSTARGSVEEGRSGEEPGVASGVRVLIPKQLQIREPRLAPAWNGGIDGH